MHGRVVDPETAADYSYMLDCVLNGPEIIYDGTKAPDELAAVALDDSTFNDSSYGYLFTEIALSRQHSCS